MPLRVVSHFVGHVLRALGYGLLGSFISALIVYIIFIERQTDLSIWHHAELDEEFTVSSDVSSFDQYLALEDRLFKQLDERVYAEVPRGSRHVVNRFSRGSLSDPGRWPVNWNRSFVLPNEQPTAGVLLLHGLTDSPYSMRALGERLHKSGAWVLGLRIPGHGTAPSALVETSWQDMAAAVRLAARQVKDRVAEKPFYVIGYSNGGALAIEYTLATLDDNSMPTPSGIVLLSAEIEVSEIAAFAVWQARLGHLLGLEKFAWSTVIPEYEPFKYGSFPVNAGDLAYQITNHNQQRLTAMQDSGKLEKMPPILAFQSSADATVIPQAVVHNLFARLPSSSHQLVLYDINRNVDIKDLLEYDPMTVFNPLLKRTNPGFDLTLVTNEKAGSNRVVAIRSTADKEDSKTSTYISDWPMRIFSLTHVALPFPPDDPVYGGPAAGKSPGIQLGNLDLRGERGVLRITGTGLLRLRWNPFFDYQKSRTLDFMNLSEK
jgi:alpha-beta hydrolase superfamily lysophospholipase